MLTKREIMEIARGLRNNVWDRECRLRAAAAVLIVLKQRHEDLNEYEFYKEADLIQGLAFSGDAA